MSDVNLHAVAIVPPYVENLFAPEVYASEAAFFALGQGIVTITFVSFRFDNSVSPAVQKKVIVGRLVLPTGGARALAAGLYDYLAKQGLTPVPKPDPDQIQ
jgi:hypothetical protein